MYTALLQPNVSPIAVNKVYHHQQVLLMVSLVINKEAGEEVKMGIGMEVHKVKDEKN
jgi:hypothetical protein